MVEYKIMSLERILYMRTSGILLHISSLPSEYGIGTMGKEAYKFIDFLHRANQSLWQILPVCPTSYGDSPYQSFSTYAGNPYFIDFDLLRKEGLLKKSEYSNIDWGSDPEYVDYEKIYNNRYTVLKKAYKRFKDTDKSDFYKFLDENERWISNYALFMSIKDEHNGKCWLQWEDNLKNRDPHSLWLFKESHIDEIEFWEFVQYKFYEQWHALKEYAHENGVKIIGDIPIYVALDSADVWVSPDLFELDDDLVPTAVAGCPPDDFSEDGQLWGNPLYAWQRHKETDYVWWTDRIRLATELYDIVRIDHFRGFDEFYSIPYGDETARNGKWVKGPGMELFDKLSEQLGELPIIAEDLGFMTDSVKKLLKDSKFPGMKVLEFAFYPDSDSEYLPHNFDKNCVAYIGTHDNPPIKEWLSETDKKSVDFAKEYMGFTLKSENDFVWALTRLLLSSSADTAIISMQDCLELGSESRMNTPSTALGNWQWRMKPDALTKKLEKKLAALTKLYGRCNLKGSK